MGEEFGTVEGVRLPGMALTVGALECRRPATLVALKNVYDQANLFLLNQNIRPGQPAAVG
ncbi:hypothetical protein [Streptomyces coeruleorubidus]|uniref:hypothetical protein n=1 Tax=Streptomyces coeruleorubidus TaxID=116188 RepID=UPI00142E974B|nr:hypothetical protein [Streptomyces coeruleorubidus]